MISENEAINNLNGLDFRVWEFTATHDMLTVALNYNGSGDKLLFFFCDSLHVGKVNKISDAKLIKNSETLIFKAIGIEIECQEIHRISEDNKSIWCMNFLKGGEFTCRRLDF